jgi:hypothetical protein
MAYLHPYLIDDLANVLPYTFYIDVHGEIPYLFRGSYCIIIIWMHDACIIEHDIQFSKSIDCSSDQVTNRILVADISRHKYRILRELQDLLKGIFDEKLSNLLLPALSFTSARTTAAPSLTNKILVSRPIPDAAPVTIATLFFNRIAKFQQLLWLSLIPECGKCQIVDNMAKWKKKFFSYGHTY